MQKNRRALQNKPHLPIGFKIYNKKPAEEKGEEKKEETPEKQKEAKKDEEPEVIISI